MNKPNVDEILQQGIHGPKEINPEERKKFLGTLRERIVVVLTQSQIFEKTIYPEIEEAIKENPKAHLYLNGNISYSDLSKYVKLSRKYNLSYKIVTNKEYDSDIGLVLAYDYAIDQKDIYIDKNKPQVLAEPVPAVDKKGIFSVFSKIFHK